MERGVCTARRRKSEENKGQRKNWIGLEDDRCDDGVSFLRLDAIVGMLRGIGLFASGTPHHTKQHDIVFKFTRSAIIAVGQSRNSKAGNTTSAHRAGPNKTQFMHARRTTTVKKSNSQSKSKQISLLLTFHARRDVSYLTKSPLSCICFSISFRFFVSLFVSFPGFLVSCTNVMAVFLRCVRSCCACCGKQPKSVTRFGLGVQHTVYIEYSNMILARSFELFTVPAFTTTRCVRC